jgi:hypothetical protein
MKLRCTSLITGGAIALMLGLVAGAARADYIGGEARDDTIKVTAQNASSLIAESAAVAAAERTTEHSRELLCGTAEADSSRLNATCTGYADGTPIRPCEAGDPLPPVWRRTRETPADPWPRWTLALGWTCPEDAMPELTVTDFRRLPLAPSVLNIQPARPQVLVNMPTIVYTEPTTQTFTTTLLGYPVEVEATPTTFTWDFGDDTDPITTTSPGHPYPDHDIAQPYTHPGTYTITLTTTHAGRYRMAGTTPWLDVAGTATTTTLSGPIEAIEIRSHLVADDCITNPHGPYC